MRVTELTRAQAIATAVAIGLSPLSLAGAVAITSGRAYATSEDSDQWSCVDDGNRICGPGNADGAPAGCYNDGGVMVAPWPCHIVVNPDGSADVYDDGPPR